MIYGEDILYNIIRFTDKDINLVQDFNCGNEVINDYLKEEACNDTKATTFIIVNNANSQIIAYYSLNCSGFVIDNGNNFTIYPAVEIKMFAIDEKYQHIPYSTNREDGNLSDTLFDNVIGYIYSFTDNCCGADKVILYSVPNAENFYKRNGFKRFENFMLQSTSLFLDGCVPMYLSL